jgi:hypothetical protein
MASRQLSTRHLAVALAVAMAAFLGVWLFVLGLAVSAGIHFTPTILLRVLVTGLPMTLLGVATVVTATFLEFRRRRA